MPPESQSKKAPKIESKDKKKEPVLTPTGYNPSQTFIDNIQRKTDEKLAVLEKRFAKNGDFDDLGKDWHRLLFMGLRSNITMTYHKFIQKYKELKSKGEEVKEELLFDEAEVAVKDKFEDMIRVLDLYAKEVPLTPLATFQLVQGFNALKGLKASPEGYAIFKKISATKGNVDLSSKEYSFIISNFDITKLKEDNTEARATDEAEKRFLATQAGSLFGLLSPEAKEKALPEIVKIKSAPEAIKLIEQLLVAGFYSSEQITKFLKSSSLPENEKSDLLKRIDSGDIGKKQKVAKEAFEKSLRRFNGRAVINPVNRIFGNVFKGPSESPMLAGLLFTWGSATAAANVAANFDSSNIGDSAKEIISSPAFWAGASAMGYGGYHLFPVTGKKAVSSVKEAFEDKSYESEKKKSSFWKKELYSVVSSNPKLEKFLIKGEKNVTGFDQLTKVFDKKIAQIKENKGKPNGVFVFTYEELEQSDLFTSEQKELLKEAFVSSGGDKNEFIQTLHQLQVAAESLKIEKGQQFANTIKIIKDEQSGKRYV